MKIIRTFYNVGQALFSKEELLDGNKVQFVSVYDCGAKSSSIIQKAIPNDSHVNRLYISHYHKDHIEGITLLLSHCKVENIILPMLTKEEKLIVISSCIENVSDQNEIESIISFIWDTKSYIVNLSNNSNATCNVFQGLQNISDKKNNDIKTNKKEDAIEDGILIRNGYINKTWNIHVLSEQELSNFVNAFNSSPKNIKQLTINAIDDIVEIWKQHSLGDIIKDALNKAGIKKFKTINQYSMTLYTGFINCEKTNGCLYLGDFDAKSNIEDLKNNYKAEWKNISIIQAPHHGSKENFNDELLENKPIVVISADNGPYKGGKINPGMTIKICKSKGSKVEDSRNGDVIISTEKK